MIYKRTYGEQDDCDHGLNHLLEKNALHHRLFGHQVLLVLVLPRVQPVILETPKWDIDS